MDVSSPAPDPGSFAQLIGSFQSHMPGFKGFGDQDGSYARSERSYKDELIAAYRRLLHPVLDGPAPSGAALHAALIHLLATEKLPSENAVQNLIGWRTVGSLARLDGEAAARAGDLAIDLLRGPGDVFERLDRFCSAYFEILRSVITGGGQADVRSIASLLLMLEDSAQYIFARINTFNAVSKRLFGRKLFGFGALPSGAEYRDVLDFAAAIRELLIEAGWPPRDMIDVQGFIWVVGGGYDALSKAAVADAPADLPSGAAEPSFPDIADRIAEQDFLIGNRLLRRYHASLAARGFVILAGLSGSGKTWLTRLYADATGAQHELCSVAPNWIGPEDLLGHLNPITDTFVPTTFTRFLEKASKEFDDAARERRKAQDYHLVLDEMNLARVEHYFARFLSAMEICAQSTDECAEVEVHPGRKVRLTPNLKFIGTVNIDETTHGFSDKVFDRAQLVEIEAPRELIVRHLGEVPHAQRLMAVWDAVQDVAPFAFRVVDDIEAYMSAAIASGASWQEALDEQVLQKVLPRLRGNDPRVNAALTALEAACSDMPLSRARTAAMAKRFAADGFVSFF